MVEEGIVLLEEMKAPIGEQTHGADRSQPFRPVSIHASAADGSGGTCVPLAIARAMKTFAFLCLAISLPLGCAPSRQSASDFSPSPATPTIQPTNSTRSADQPVPSGSVRISYEVLRPGDYPYTEGMRVQDLVAAAGGLTPFASGIRVVRAGTNLLNAYYGSLRRTNESKYMVTPLEPGDRVWIKRRD